MCLQPFLLKNVQINPKKQGFTLIELLTVVTLLGILSGLALQAFYIYRSNGYYAVSDSTLRNARTALEAGLTNVDNLPGAVPLTAQNGAGSISDPAMAALLPGMRLPSSVKLQALYDDSCDVGACTSEMLQVNHCKGKEYVRYVRFGDGSDILLQHVAGPGCP